MSISYQEIGAWCATFAADEVEEGHVVKVSGNAKVSECSSGDAFCGVVSALDDDACSVQLGGMVSVAYSGTAPSAGFAILVADGNGGVKSAESGTVYLVSEVNTTAGTLTIKL